MKGKRVFLNYGLVFVFCILCFAFFFLAFPNGLLEPDTIAYRNCFLNFHWLSPNDCDWVRTPPFPLLLGLAWQFPDPSVAMIWLNAILFSLSIVSIAWMMTAFFKSLQAGILFALAIMLGEMIFLHAFPYVLVILSDSAYSSLILIGSMLVLGGWIRRVLFPFWMGFFVLGLAAWMKPVGVCLLPIWMLFAFFIWLEERHTSSTPFTLRSILLSCVLLILCTVFWITRNGLVIGEWAMTGFGARNLFPHTLSLLQDDDQIFPDPAFNKTFIEHIRSFGKAIGTEEDVYRWNGNKEYPNMFVVMAPLTPINQRVQGSLNTLQMLQNMFELDRIGNKAALNLILLHPKEYAALVWHHYVLILSDHPYPLVQHSYTLYEQYTKIIAPKDFQSFYPPLGYPTTIDAHVRVRSVFITLLQSRRLYIARTALQFFLIWWYHILLVACPVLYILQRKKVYVILFMLILTALSQYFLTALVEAGWERYSLPGEVGLHVSALLSFILIGKWLFARIKTLIRS